LQDTIDNFKFMREQGSTQEARQSKLLIGPWAHGVFTNPIGEKNFGLGSSAAYIDLQIDLTSLQLRWFDHWLRGIDTGMLSEAPVRIFVMGANVWRDEQAWPLERAVDTPFYLRADGGLSTEPPDAEPPDRFTYDPRNPVPTHGGA